MPRARPSSWPGRYGCGTPLWLMSRWPALRGTWCGGLPSMPSTVVVPSTPWHSRGWSSHPPRGPSNVDRDALVHDCPNDFRTLVSLRRRAALSAVFRRSGWLASGERLVFPRPLQLSPLGAQAVVATQVEGPSPDPSRMSRVQLRSDDATMGQRVRHALSGMGLLVRG